MLVAHDSTWQRVLARHADRRLMYFCPVCEALLVLRQGKVRVWHFAHPPGSECLSAGETQEHLEMKEHLYLALSAQMQSCELEYSLGERRIDIWLGDGGLQVAIECQASRLPVEELRHKLVDYSKAGLYCLYIIHAHRLTGASAQKQPLPALDGKEVRVADWIRALHALYWGRVYVYDQGSVFPVHLEKVYRYVENAYNADGEEVGDYDTLLKATKTLRVGKPIKNLSDIQCQVTNCLSRALPDKGYLIARFWDKAFW